MMTSLSPKERTTSCLVAFNKNWAKPRKISEKKSRASNETAANKMRFTALFYSN